MEHVWSVGGYLGVARRTAAAGGSSSDAFTAGGDTDRTSTEEYNGTAWSAGGNLGTGRWMFGSGSSGNSTDAITVSGYISDNSLVVEEYNGTSWSAGGDVTTARRFHHNSGNSTSAIISCGMASSATNNTEEYNGTSWGAGGNATTARYGCFGDGSVSDAIISSGLDASTGYIGSTEEYNGTAWGAGGAINTQRAYSSGGGNSSSAICTAGQISGGHTNATEEYNGSTWSAGGNLGTARRQLGGSNNVVCGGYTTFPVAITEEYLILPLYPGKPLQFAINEWQSIHYGAHGAGLPYSEWTNATGVSGGATSPGRTLIFPARSFRQAGTVHKVNLNVRTYYSSDWKFKVFRWDGSEYDYVGESAFNSFAASTGDHYLELSSPITVQVGDIPGLYMPYSAGTKNELNAKLDAATLPMRYTTGDITSSDSFSSTVGALPSLEALMTTPPFIAIIGDSKAEGHNNGGSGSADSYHTEFHNSTVVNTLPGGVQSSEILYELAQLVSALKYQNVGVGSITFAELASTYAAIALAQLPQILLIECGVNDVAASRAWSAVEDDLDTIYSLFLVSGCQLILIDEILPWTNGDATQAATIRTWNSNLATWATGKSGVAIVESHDPMKDPENTDNMLPAYDFDGIHLTTAGVAALAGIIHDKILQLYSLGYVATSSRYRRFQALLVR